LAASGCLSVAVTTVFYVIARMLAESENRATRSTKAEMERFHIAEKFEVATLPPAAPEEITAS
jgi:hypothetical protein